jgi:1-acylglycerone phosphate reductase
MATTHPHQPTVLVTGCSEGGIGFSLVQEFHRRGLRVFAAVRNLSRAQSLQNSGIEVVQLDVADPTSVSHAITEVSRLTGGSLDILVNNAGSGYKMPLLDADLDQARALFDVNVWGVLALTQASVPLLRRGRAISGSTQHTGRIVNIGSVTSRIPVPWQGVCTSFQCRDPNIRVEDLVAQ